MLLDLERHMESRDDVNEEKEVSLVPGVKRTRDGLSDSVRVDVGYKMKRNFLY